MSRTARRLLVVFLASSCGSSIAHSATLKVPADFGTIQAAITASANGDVIEISAGTYLETLSISSKTNLTIQPKGGAKVFVDGGGSGSNLLNISMSNQIHVKKVRFRNGAGGGISSSFSSFVTLEKCRVENVSGTGIVFLFGSAHHVDGCKVTSVGGSGVVVLDEASVIHGCKIQGAGGHGIEVHAGQVTVDGNIIDSPGGAGVALGSTTILAAPTPQCLVIDNKIMDSGQDAILLEAESSACVIIGNTITKPVGGGSIDIVAGSDGHVILNNSCKSNAAHAGIGIDGQDCVVDGNSIKKCMTGLVIGGNADGVLAVDNKVQKSGTIGVQVLGGTHFFVRNTALNSGTFDLDDDAGVGVNTFIDNSFGTIDP